MRISINNVSTIGEMEELEERMFGVARVIKGIRELELATSYCVDDEVREVYNRAAEDLKKICNDSLCHITEKIAPDLMKGE